ncbi:MAG TPA: DUF885 family protein [Mycobacteriales bacterium]|nr:DUF885 family protein [Mycobacteriales bacterium]
MEPRLRALCDLGVSWAREGSGRHEYDGQVQDLSPAGVRRGLAALGGDPLADPYDEALVSAKEAETRAYFEELRLHRRNPMPHVENLDVGGYDREYAPAAERAAARARHLAAWPQAVDASISALDEVVPAVAAATLPGARGLAAGLDEDDPVEAAALAAQQRLVAHLEAAAGTGDSGDGALGAAALGPDGLSLLLSAAEATEVDLAAMAARADAERDRLTAMLTEACARLAPGRPVAELVAELQRDHPDAEGVIAEAQALTDEVIAWTTERRLVPYSDGTCLVGPAPESRQWAMAMMSWAAPGEPDTPSWYWVTPPRPEWPEQDREEWLQIFSRTTLPAITVHEVAPGHFSHGIALRHAPSEPRRVFGSNAFVEGWAHYVEEVAIEEGFHAEDPRYVIGVAIEALLRVTRLACAIGLHAEGMTVAEAARRFERDAFLAGPGAMSEARRGTFDPTYGRYTWGKLEIMALREQAREQWGADFDLPRFHAALLDLGSPPLGLLGHALG